MKKEKMLKIHLFINTDGDFSIENNDNYFKVGIEEYTKDIYVDLNVKDLNPIVESLFAELKSRVSSKYKSHLVDCIKNLDVYKPFHIRKKVDFNSKLKQLLKNGFCDTFYYLSGNQEIELYLSKVDGFKFENDEEKKEYELYQSLENKYKDIIVIE